MNLLRKPNFSGKQKVEGSVEKSTQVEISFGKN